MILFQGDCRNVLRGWPDNTADALVTDPPAGIGFMGRDWDGDKGGRDEWIAWLVDILQQCYRVLKPGGHGLVWGLPRTSHWTATACENAGFEVRDCVCHLFGTGFPKSLDVSKAIDKAAGAKRAKVPATGGLTANANLNDDNWGKIGAENPEMDGPEPVTPEAATWNGWGTALKPAAEFWYLIRKPLSEKTVAANVLRWGTGAINVAACRIGSDSHVNSRGPHKAGGSSLKISETGAAGLNPQVVVGRWPANVVHDGSPEVVAEFAKAGESKSPGRTSRGGRPEQAGGFGMGSQEAVACPNDAGTAARFFYCAKASKSEKEAGLNELAASRSDYRENDPDENSIRTRLHGSRLAKNNHPTVKPLALMTWLIKLITPPGGRVIDPFAGSGSTGVAAIKNGFDFWGVEFDPGFAKIAQARLDAAAVLNLNPTLPDSHEQRDAAALSLAT